MAYNGYGYSNYQHTNARAQSQTPYTPSSQAPKPVASAPQNNHQDYGQLHGSWSGQSVSGAQTSSPQNVRNNYWMPSTNNNPSQSMAYQQQVSYRMSDTDQTTNPGHQYNSQPKPQHHTSTHDMRGYRDESSSSMGARRDMATSSTHYATNSSQDQTGVIPPTAPPQTSQTYQSNLPSHQPDYMQSSRTAAATAMTALSSATRHNYAQNTQTTTPSTYQKSNSAQYPTSTSGPTRSQLESNTASSSNSLYQYQASGPGQSLEVTATSASNTIPQNCDASDMSTHSATPSAEPSPQLQHRAHQTQTVSHPPSLLHHTNRTSSGSQIRPTASRYSTSYALSDNARPSQTLSQDAYSQPTGTTSAAIAPPAQSPLPRFVDPTNIYNPYYRQHGSSGATATTQSTVEKNVTSGISGADAAQTVEPQHSTQSPVQNASAPEAMTDATVSNTYTNTPEAPMAKEPSKEAPKDVSKNTPKKVRKKANRKQKSEAASTSKPVAAEPQASPVTQEQTNKKEDTASQMQRLLDEMRMKDPELFKSILAANMSKSENREQDIQQTPTNGTLNSPLPRVPNTSCSAEPSQPRISSNITPSKMALNKSTPGGAIFLVSTPAQKGVAPSAINNLSVGNPEVELGSQETASIAVKPRTTCDGDTDGPPQIIKTGLINGLPDLGKFPALRRRRKMKARLPADEPNQDSTTTLHVNHEINASDQSSQPTPNLQATTRIPQPYASLSIEEQRLSLLDNFTKTGHAELPNPPDIPPPSATEDAQSTQMDNTSGTLAAPPPPPQHPLEEAKKEDKATTFWPDHKRRVLAESACEYIATFPGNASITADFVSGLIEQNPSYVQLCNMLEGHGYTINKVHFAKHLLQAFPDLGESSGKTTKPIPQPTLQVPQPTLPVSSFVSTTPPPATLPHLPPATFPQSSPKGVRPQKGATTVKSGPTAPLSREEQRQKSLNLLHLSRRRKSASQRRTSISTSPAPQPRGALPNSKEAMARKRTFAEIVDLSQALDDEEETDAEDEKVGQLSQVEVTEDPMDISPDCTVETTPNTTIPTQPLAVGVAQSPPRDRDVAQIQPVRSREPSAAAQPAPKEPVNLAKYKYTRAPHINNKENLRRYDGIVKPMNKAKALKRSYYDPRTIARDILIAAGRHPTERPLNQHLLKLKEKFQYVDYSSDLETFRWDLVDPGGPPPPKIAPEPLITQPKFDSRDIYQNPRDGASSTQLVSFDRAPSHLRNSQTANTDPLSRSMAPTQVRSSFACPLPTRPGPRRAGRPPGAKNKTKPAPSLPKHVEVAIPTATPQKSSNKYQIYECRFDGCGAKLHNFEIFRKHVLKLHGRPEQDQAVCMWTGCALSGQKGQRVFSTEALREHLDSVHLSPLAWKLGDGPKSISSGHPCFNPDSCLYDDKGRAVVSKATTNGCTPSIILPTTWRPIRDFNKNHGYDSYKSSALQIMRALTAKQANVGAGLGPGGCILMNEQRQSTVVASESVFKVHPPLDSKESR